MNNIIIDKYMFVWKQFTDLIVWEWQVWFT